jgi:DNA-binding CsgD family transcriptional regulator/PAS domain-containing protein
MACRDEASLSRLICDLYEAAYDDAALPRALESFRIAFDGSRACLGVQDLLFDDVDVACTAGDPRFYESYLAHYAPANVIWKSGRTMPIGHVFCDRMVLPRPDYLATEFVSDWMLPQGDLATISCKTASEGAVAGFFTVTRGATQQDFDDADHILMRRLAPTMVRVGELRRTLRMDAIEKHTARLALDALSCAVVIVDASLAIVLANAAATDLFAAPSSGLVWRRGQLATAEPAAAAGLVALVGDACGRAGGVRGAGGSLRLSAASADDGPDLAVSVSPLLDPQAYGLAGRPLARDRPLALVLATPIALAAVDAVEDALVALFGLTPAESRLAAMLAAGATLAEAAARCGIRLTTAKTHLGRCFQKTGAGRQGDLVALIKDVTLPLRRPPSRIRTGSRPHRST